MGGDAGIARPPHTETTRLPNPPHDNPEPPPTLILASGSPRRRDLLGAFGIPFQIIVSDAPEAIDPSLLPEAQAVVLAERKARAVAANLASGLVLGADTIVALDGEFLGKPANDRQAARMLRRLSGREHRVVTGLAVIEAATGSARTSSVFSTVRFQLLRDDDIARYIATGESHDKAGAYAIQGRGAELVAALHGCYTNVVGLPLCETARLLCNVGMVIPDTWPGCRLPDGSKCPRLWRAYCYPFSMSAIDDGSLRPPK